MHRPVPSRKAPSSHPGRDARPAKGAKGPAVPGRLGCGTQASQVSPRNASTFSFDHRHHHERGHRIGPPSAEKGVTRARPRTSFRSPSRSRTRPAPRCRPRSRPQSATTASAVRYSGGRPRQSSSCRCTVVFHVVQSGEVDVSAVCLRRVGVSAWAEGRGKRRARIFFPALPKPENGPAEIAYFSINV